MLRDRLIKLVPSRQNLEENRRIIKLLKNLGNLKQEYPTQLLADRREDFINQVEHYLQSKKQVIQHLDNNDSHL